MAVGGDFLGEFFDLLKSKFLVRHFAPAKTQRDFHLHVFAQEVDGVAQLHSEIVRVDLRAELDLFDLVGVLMFPGFLVLLGLLVTVFAEIHQAANRRDGGGGDFNQVHPVRPGHVDGVRQRDDTELLAVGADDANFAGADFPVYPDSGTRRERGTRGERAAQDTPGG
jgi:hypothetical protein